MPGKNRCKIRDKILDNPGTKLKKKFGAKFGTNLGIKPETKLGTKRE
jgi:hypothetical protein